MNEAAKKIVAREARAAAREYGAPSGDLTDQAMADAFATFEQTHPNVAQFRGAESYFGAVFADQFNETIERRRTFGAQ